MCKQSPKALYYRDFDAFTRAIAVYEKRVYCRLGAWVGYCWRCGNVMYAGQFMRQSRLGANGLLRQYFSFSSSLLYCLCGTGVVGLAYDQREQRWDIIASSTTCSCQCCVAFKTHVLKIHQLKSLPPRILYITEFVKECCGDTRRTRLNRSSYRTHRSFRSVPCLNTPPVAQP